MAKEKKVIPKYISPYHEVQVTKDDLTFFVEVMDLEDKEELNKHMDLKCEVLKNSTTTYAESTLKRASNLPSKLFLCETEEDVINTVSNAVGMSFTAEFRPRAFTDVLITKLILVEDEKYRKLMGYVVKSLDEHACITTVIKSMFSLLTGKKDK